MYIIAILSLLLFERLVAKVGKMQDSDFDYARRER